MTVEAAAMKTAGLGKTNFWALQQFWNVNFVSVAIVYIIYILYLYGV